MRKKSELRDTEFHISSFSGGGACVAVAQLASGDYVVRHSRDTDHSMVFSREEWKAFISGVKNEEFDF